MTSRITPGGRFCLAAGAALIACAGTVQASAIVEPELERLLAESAPNETVSALVYLAEQVDADALTAAADAARFTLSERHEMVVRTLQDTAERTQPNLLAYIEQGVASGAVSDYEAFWVGNIVRVDATPDFIEGLSERFDVGHLYPNYGIELIEPVSWEADDGDGGGRAVEEGVAAVRAPEVWAMGITGSGVLVANIDTGVDGNHPALFDRWAGNLPQYDGNPEWAWLDPYAGNNSFPYDTNGHGTHTMGSVLGGAPGDEIGVAPGAHWMAAGAIDRGGGIPQTVADAIESFQWMIDPDGDPSTNWDVPATCSNSWGLVTAHGYPPCDETFWSYLDNCEAAGIAIIFSAGNEGFSGLRRPGDRAESEYRTMAVAAVDPYDPSWPVASFSSRGPTFCTLDGTSAIKPDIAAPGVNTRSALPGGGYGSLSGTSMASPHVNGVVALMREANPDLAVEEIMQIIYDTAYDLGGAGKDNNYGWGMVDAYEAVNMALSTVSLRFEFPADFPVWVDPNGGTRIEFQVTGQSVQPQPGTGKFYYSTGAGFTEGTVVEIEPNIYEAVFPAFDCGANVDYYFSAETTDGETVVHPYNAPDSFYSAEAYTGLEIFLADDLETDTGWTVGAPDDDATTGVWNRMDPQGTAAQPEDDHTDDPGVNCWVTDGFAGNGLGDYDIDNGKTTLYSPVWDLTGMEDATLSYYRWYSNNTGADPGNDIFVVDISTDGGASWSNLETVGPTGPGTTGGWVKAEFRVGDIIVPTTQVQLRFVASDESSGSIVEAAIDDVQVDMLYCDDAGCPGDFNGDGTRDQADLGALLGAYGVDDGGDMDGDGDTDQADLGALLGVYGEDCP